jgi:hypothetical protein
VRVWRVGQSRSHSPPVDVRVIVQSLVKRYTRHNLTDINGPITIVTGKSRRITLFECPNDINAMVVRIMLRMQPHVSHALISSRVGDS